MNRGTSRFERNLARFSRKNPRPLDEWTIQEERAAIGAIVLAAIVTIAQWVTLPLVFLYRKLWPASR